MLTCLAAAKALRNYSLTEYNHVSIPWGGDLFNRQIAGWAAYVRRTGCSKGIQETTSDYLE